MDWQLVASYFTVKSTDISYSVHVNIAFYCRHSNMYFFYQLLLLFVPSYLTSSDEPAFSELLPIVSPALNNIPAKNIYGPLVNTSKYGVR